MPSCSANMLAASACMPCLATCLVCLHLLLPDILLKLPGLTSRCSPCRIHADALTVLLVKTEGVLHQHIQLRAEVQLHVLLQLLGPLQCRCSLSALVAAHGRQGRLQRDVDITAAC